MTDTTRVAELYRRILGEVSKVIIGKEVIKEALALALLAGGHLLIEGLPGSAKTKLARTFAEIMGGTFKRIQFTPDMLPADVTGFYVYSPTGAPRLTKGPIFANIVLADELNRTTPRTQSALLEAMQEYQVTIERETFLLERPFIVIATQVQSGGEGTYSLADVQMDRFLLRVDSEYSTKEEEMQVITDPVTQGIMGGYGFWEDFFVAGYLEEALISAFAASDDAIINSPSFKAVSDRLPDETRHDETYNFRFRPKHGSGLQMLQREDGKPGDAYHIVDGSTICLDRGYHPCAALPGYEMYYFTILGGLSQRSLVQYFQPSHAYQIESIPGIKDMIAKFK